MKIIALISVVLICNFGIEHSRFKPFGYWGPLDFGTWQRFVTHDEKLELTEGSDELRVSEFASGPSWNRSSSIALPLSTIAASLVVIDLVYLPYGGVLGNLFGLWMR